MSKSSSTPPAPEFSGLRAFFWPIHAYEVKKFIPMGLMMFCALFNYTILRDVKDAVVVKGISAESISFIKLGIVTPLAILFVALYTKLSNTLSRDNLFYASLLPFLVFFGLFGLVLYPYKHLVMVPLNTLNEVVASYPAQLEHFIRIGGRWPYVLFYAFAELWGSVVIALLFWQFANQITRVLEARRFYALFGLIGNMGLILSGTVLKFLTNYGRSIVGEDGNPFEVSLKYITLVFLFFGFLFVYLYRWVHKNVLTDPRLYDSEEKKPKKKKVKLSFSESIKVIISTPYLWLIFSLVVGYGVAQNLVEITWKKQVGIAYANENDYTNFMGSFSIYTGLFTIMFMLIGSNIVRKFGWLTAALVTPLMILITGAIFYSCIVFPDFMGNALNTALPTAIVSLGSFMEMVTSNAPIILAVFIGALQNILSKATKYSLFDSTKEMSYIPLPDELKTKGKAAVDVIGGRAGKSGGSAIQMLLLLTIGAGAADGQNVIAPFLFFFVIAMVALWIFAVVKLNVKFKEAERLYEEENKKAA